MGQHRTRPAEDFDVLEFRPEFNEAFGFSSTKREVVYSLEAQFNQVHHSRATAAWDIIFGPRWDIVVGGTYVVTRIIFRRDKFKAPFAVVDKLRCKLDLMNVTPHGDYRSNVYDRMCDKYRLHRESAPTVSQESEPDDENKTVVMSSVQSTQVVHHQSPEIGLF